MASKFQETERLKQVSLIDSSKLFDNSRGGGSFMGKPREFVLKEAKNNLFSPIREDVVSYFEENKISWWGGKAPSGHLLSSQISCLNHLFYIRKDKDIVLSILNSVRNEFKEVLPIPCDENGMYIGFEVISGADYLNEKRSIRGSNCTSIDAFIYARHRSGELWLIPIEWKYTEYYDNQDKSTEDRKGAENKGLNGIGNVRLARYTSLIDKKEQTQLKKLSEYKGSIYYQEPFYQLMRQTLWAEEVVAHKGSANEPLKADNYFHIHVIPNKNTDLLDKKYRVSGKGMEESWRSCLNDQSKYTIVDPVSFLEPISNKYSEFWKYLNARYW